MTHYSIKAYSRTTSEDDANKMSRYVYNGSFGANETNIDVAFNTPHSEAGRAILSGWSQMMDCFYDVLFIRVDTDEVQTFNQYED